MRHDVWLRRPLATTRMTPSMHPLLQSASQGTRVPSTAPHDHTHVHLPGFRQAMTGSEHKNR